MEGHWDTNAAVRLLMVLQNRHDDARHRAQRAVECGQGPRLVAVAHTDLQATSLKLGGVRGRRDLAIRALRRNPRLDVELACRTAAEIARSHVDHAIGQFQSVDELALPCKQAFVLSLGILRTAVGEHLDLVELVHADDAAGVLAVRTGFAAVAR